MKVFLSNNKNKQRFIHTPGEKLLSLGCRVIYCEGDADVDIVMTAIMLAQENHVIVVGEDTDLLALLLNHFNEQHSSNNIYCSSDREKTGKEGVVYKYEITEMYSVKICASAFYFYILLGVILLQHSAELVRVHIFSR